MSLRLRIAHLRARARGARRAVRRRLGLGPRQRRAAISWGPASGSWKISPQGIDVYGIAHELTEDEVELGPEAGAEEVGAALRSALGRNRYLDAGRPVMSTSDWRRHFGAYQLVHAVQAGGRLDLYGCARVRRDGRRCYEPVAEIAGSLPADAAPQEVFALLAELMERIRRHEEAD